LDKYKKIGEAEGQSYGQYVFKPMDYNINPNDPKYKKAPAGQAGPGAPGAAAPNGALPSAGNGAAPKTAAPATPPAQAAPRPQAPAGQTANAITQKKTATAPAPPAALPTRVPGQQQD
jgi:hypothetical protein